MRDGELYARGAADDKGQVFCLLKAYEATLDAERRPPLNVHFIFEGEEECGGQVIVDLLRAEPERTRADAALVCDMSYYAPGWPAVYTALRGLCYAEISVRTLERDLHSGTYGGVAPNALETLVRHPGQAQGRRWRDPDSQALQGGRAADQARAQDLEAAPVRQGAPSCGRK